MAYGNLQGQRSMALDATLGDFSFGAIGNPIISISADELFSLNGSTLEVNTPECAASASAGVSGWYLGCDRDGPCGKLLIDGITFGDIEPKGL